MNAHEPVTEKLISVLNADPELKKLLEKSIEAAARINPDRSTNPVRSLEGYFRFIDGAAVPCLGTYSTAQATTAFMTGSTRG